MKLFISFLITFLVFGCIMQTKAQNNNLDKYLHLRAINRGDSVVLRWATPNEIVWTLGKDSGYVVERAEFTKQKPVFKAIKTVKPWSFNEMETAYNASKNNQLGVMWATIFGKTGIDLEQTSIDELKQAASAFKLKMGFSQLAADLNAMAANAGGFRFVDEKIPAKKSYYYRIKLNISTKDVYSDTVIVDGFQIDSMPTLPMPIGLSADKSAYLKIDFLTQDFIAFDVERSIDNGRTVKKINELPFIVIDSAYRFQNTWFYQDSLVQNYSTYQYRIRGYTPFGELTPYSDWVSVMPRDFTPPQAPVITYLPQADSKVFELKWDFEGDQKELLGFQLGIGEQIDGPFMAASDIFSPQTRKHIHDKPDLINGHFIVVWAIDTAGNRSESIPRFAKLKDETPPSPPIWITGTCDSSGFVTLNWHPSPELDVKGYRLYRSNDVTHEFALAHPFLIQDTTFVDSITLATLTENIFYRLVPIDFSWNVGEANEILQVKRVDLIKPQPPLLVNTKGVEHGIAVQVNRSVSTDVQKQWLQRTTKINNIVESTIIQITHLDSNFVLVDTTALNDLTYRYVAFAQDSAGNTSDPSWEIFGNRAPASNRQGKLNIAFDKSEKKAILAWEAPIQADYLVIYKTDLADDTRWDSFVSLSVKQNEYMDKALEKDKQYRYMIKFIGKKGEFWSNQVNLLVD